MSPYRFLLFIILLLLGSATHAQKQDVEFHPNGQFLQGKIVLKVKRDFHDPYVWVLAKNNEVYRINSTTMVVDDYTPQFSTYNNFQFIDIAGRSQDTVFIATNSANVIEYKKGLYRTIGVSDGLTDTVNSIGMANFSGDILYGGLEIGTTRGRGDYDPVAETLHYYQFDSHLDGKIYEASYRHFTATENSYLYYLPQAIPVSNWGYPQGVICEISRVAASGNNVTTALTTGAYVSGAGGFYDSSSFWGNEKGMFEESANNFNYAAEPYGYYLKNIKVNKITDIFGLAGLGDPYNTNISPFTMARENLLIGTDNGLYFTSSIYGNFNADMLHNFSLFHYDILGNERVNDICVNGTVGDYFLTSGGCEGGVWVACDNGLYFIKPDYAKYVDPKFRLNAIRCSKINYGDTTSAVKVCSGDTVQFGLGYQQAKNTIIQWVKNGQDLPGENGTTLTATSGGEYYAVIYASCENIHVETNHFKVQVISSPVFNFDYPDKLQFCDSTSTTLKTDNNSLYHYRWYADGVLTGDTAYKYQVIKSGKYRVEVSACTNSWVSSKEIEVDLINLPLPQLSVPKTTYCQGDTATIKSGISPDASYTLNWYLNGNLLANNKDLAIIKATLPGIYMMRVTSNIKADCMQVSSQLQLQFISSPVFSFNYPDQLQYCDSTSVSLKTDNNAGYRYRWYTDGTLNGDTTYKFTVTKSGRYKVEVSACTNSWVASKEIETELIYLPKPVLKADKAIYCAGAAGHLSINIPTDAGYTINWYKDGNVISTAKDKTDIEAISDGSYSVVISSNVTSCIETSNTLKIIFTPSPHFISTFPDKWIACDAAPVILNVVGDKPYRYRWYTNGVLNGDTSATMNAVKSGTYKVEASSCEGSWLPSNEISVQLIHLPLPVIQTDKSAYCIGDNAKLTVSAVVDPNYNIQWYKDNVPINSNTNQTNINVNEQGSYSVVITSNITNSDGTVCTQSSTPKILSFSPPPSASIQRIIRTTLCDGQSVDLKVSYNDGTARWSTGESSDQISVSTSGIYKATVTTASGCATEAETDVQFLPNPVLNLRDEQVCISSHKTITLTAPSGMVSYVWNNQPGTETFTVDHPQTVTLSVTDANGCGATQDILITDECADLKIPNAFTPNGDGVNDQWIINGLEYDLTAVVKIFTRYGKELYQSRGYTKPWNGTYQGKLLPSGVYYYVITTKNGGKRYSGSVTIIF